MSRIVRMRGRNYSRHNAKGKCASGWLRGCGGMNIAFCYESVLPARGGCETYIADLARRLLAIGMRSISMRAVG